MGERERTELADLLADATRQMLATRSVAETMQRVVDLAVVVIPAVESAGISVLRERGLSTPVASDDRVAAVDRLETEVGEGPCIDAIKEHAWCYCPDLSAETRWPKFSRPAARLGLRSLLAYRLFVGPDTYGVLNLYSRLVDAFTEDGQHVAWLLASHASVALFHARARAGEEQEVAQLREAIGSRDVIGQAKGILMAQRGLSDEEAFAVLVKRSQLENRKLRLVAGDVVRSLFAGAGVPDPPPGEA